VIQFGANMEVVPPGESVLGRCEDRKCRLLFVGRDFKRKGGSYALEALEALRRRGVDAHLVILGSVPPTAPSSDQVEVIPYLDKNNPADVRRIYDLYMGSHYLLFPTRADCSPIALCEAAAFGLPVVSSQVGGIASIVSEGENGFLLPLDADANAYADRIESSFADRERYRQLVQSSRARYDALLNWDRWAERLEPVLRQAAST
jgi:glycosyltransferase involved in cell wall biosynthesis